MFQHSCSLHSSEDPHWKMCYLYAYILQQVARLGLYIQLENRCV